MAYTFSSKSKAALIDNLALMFEQRTITIPRAKLWPEGVEELEAFEYSVSDAGNVRTSAPGGMHDDIVVSLGLAAWHRRPTYQQPCSFVPPTRHVGSWDVI